jgi:hypothetical protein
MMMSKAVSRSLVFAGLLALLWLLLPAPTHAQSTYGMIVGAVTDPTGALIVGGSVTVTNTETNISKTVLTRGDGNYEATHLLPGTYRVRAETAGFKTARRDSVILESRATVRVDFQLEVGATTTEIQVVATTPVIESETAQLADARTAWQINELPALSAQETFSYLFTLPGVQSVSINTYSFNGSRAAQYEFMIDGIPSPRSSTALGGTHDTLGMVSEVRLHNGGNSAEFQSPAAISIVTAAGTNALHGSLIYYHSNSALNARDFFTPVKSKTKSHEYGFTLGGPVWAPKIYDGRNRTFFMLSYWGNRIPGMHEINATVPTAAMRRGDFSAFSALTDPGTGTPFPGNQVPAARLSSIATRVQERFFPAPNFGDPQVLVSSNYRTLLARRSQHQHLEGRIDQKLTDKNLFYVRYAWKGTVQEPAESLPTIGVRNGYRRGSSFVASDTHTFGPSLVNEARAGFQHSPNQVLGPLNGMAVLRDVGVQGVQGADNLRGMPRFLFNRLVTDVTTSVNNTVDLYEVTTFMNVATLIRGKHTVRAGLDLRRQAYSGIDLPGQFFGEFNFNGFFTGNAYADFLLGLPLSSTRATYRGDPSLRQTSQYLFVEDAWRLGQKITLTLGARYEYQYAAVDKQGLMYNLDPRTMSLVVPDSTSGSGKINPLLPSTIPIVKASDAGYPQSLRLADKDNFVPRLGLAYRPSAHLVIRAGYGIYIDDFGLSITPSYGSPLYGFTETFQNTDRRRPTYVLPNPFGGAGSIGTISASGYRVDLANPYVQQWNLTLERELADIGFRLSYIGTKATGLGYARDLNIPVPSTTPFNNNRRPFPQYRALTFSENGGNSIYHSLQADAERRFARGLYFQAAWTWSNLLSDVSDSGADLGPTIESPFDRRRERAREGYSVRHRVNGALIYQVPVGRGRRFLSGLPAVANHALGGWTLSGLFYFETGRYFTPSFSGVDISATGTTGGRPDRIGNGNLPPGERSVDRWFDPAAFVVPAANTGRFGNCGRNILEAPGLNVQHFSLIKRFWQKEQRNIQFQLNALNIFNHPNFSPPSANISTASTVARVTSMRTFREAAGARTMTAELRINF